MNKTLVSISAAVIACAIGVATPLASAQGGENAARNAQNAKTAKAADTPEAAQYNPNQKLNWRMSYIVGDLEGSQDAQANALLAIEQINESVYAKTPKYEQERRSAESKLKNSTTTAETYPILDHLAKVAGGNNSALIKPGNVSAAPEDHYKLPQVTKSDDIVTVKLPRVNTELMGLDDYESASGTELLNKMPNSCGAIIDLRDANGPDMGTMLRSLHPLLPAETLMRKKFPDTIVDIGIEPDNPEAGAGQAAGAGAPAQAGATAEKGRTPIYYIPPATPDNKFTDKPVAILTGGNTGGAGEATLLGFRGLNSAKTFGQPTAGLIGEHNVAHMPDGSTLVNTINTYIDRKGEEFNDKPINPDVNTSNPEKDAAAWLKQQCHNGNAVKR